MRKTAVQFGAGNIGRGFMGQLFHESGYDTVFIDVDEALIAALNTRHAYPLRIVDSPSRNASPFCGAGHAPSPKKQHAKEGRSGARTLR